MRRFALAFGLATSIACVRSTTPTEAPVVVSVSTVADAPKAIAVGPVGTCTLYLVADRIHKSSSGCVLDQHLTTAHLREGRGRDDKPIPGTLTYPCTGDGPADATFADHRYEGNVTGGVVHLELHTELDWDDGCKWGTDHILRGTLTQGGKPTLQRLAWRYADRILTGTDCSGSCTANAAIDVKTSKIEREPEEDDEPDD